jgi:hypothetical protein
VLACDGASTICLLHVYGKRDTELTPVPSDSTGAVGRGS